LIRCPNEQGCHPSAVLRTEIPMVDASTAHRTVSPGLSITRVSFFFRRWSLPLFSYVSQSIPVRQDTRHPADLTESRTV